MRHLDNSGHTESNVNLYPDMAVVGIRMLPGYRSWTRPTARQLRKWVDENIAQSDNPARRRAVGKPATFNVTSGGWTATYDLVNVA